MKVTVIGAGNVGATTAMRIAESDVCREVVLVDIAPGLAEGLALDLGQSAPIEGFRTRITGTTDYALTANSDVIVMTAGRPRSPGMSRMDLLLVNAAVVRSCVEAATAALAVRDPDRRHQPARRDDAPRVARVGLPAEPRDGHGRRARLGPPAVLPGRARERRAARRRGDDARLARRHDGAAARPGHDRRHAGRGGARPRDARRRVPAHPRRRRRDRRAAAAGLRVLRPCQRRPTRWCGRSSRTAARCTRSART